MVGENIAYIIVLIFGYIILFSGKEFYKWIFKNKYYHITSIIIGLINIILTWDWNEGFLTWIWVIPIIILTYYMVNIVIFGIYWNIKYKGRNKPNNTLALRHSR